MTAWAHAWVEGCGSRAWPEQNDLAERVIRTLKAQGMHRHRFESLRHAGRRIGDRIHFYNYPRPHQALGLCVSGLK